jgi:hypothetical protein
MKITWNSRSYAPAWEPSSTSKSVLCIPCHHSPCLSAVSMERIDSLACWIRAWNRCSTCQSRLCTGRRQRLPLNKKLQEGHIVRGAWSQTRIYFRDTPGTLIWWASLRRRVVWLISESDESPARRALRAIQTWQERRLVVCKSRSKMYAFPN